MATSQSPEVWLRGPVPGILPLLQPIAHALLQAKEEIAASMKDFPNTLLWERPAGVASAGFHLQHLCGVLDRLFSYAQGRSLSEAQLTALKAEGVPGLMTAEELVVAFHEQVDKAVKELEGMQEQMLLEPRGVGRAQLPSTVLGLLFHAAEHTMRHTGQLLVTSKVVRGGVTM